MLHVALSLACGYAGGLCWYASTCFALDGAERLSR